MKGWQYLMLFDAFLVSQLMMLIFEIKTEGHSWWWLISAISMIVAVNVVLIYDKSNHHTQAD